MRLLVHTVYYTVLMHTANYADHTYYTSFYLLNLRCCTQVRILMHTMHEAERLVVRSAVAREATARGLVRRSCAQSRAQRLKDGGLGPGAAEVGQHEARAEEAAARRRQTGEEQGLLVALQSQALERP